MIKELRIKNFKCFSDEAIPFHNLTILAGSNGMGKSTVIQSILLIRQTIEEFSKFNAINDISQLRVLLNGPFLLNLGNAIEIINSSINADVISFQLLDDSLTQKETFEYEVDENNTLGLNFLFRNPMTLSSESPIYFEEFHYLAAERLGPRNIQNIVDQEYITTGYQGEYAGQAIAKAETINWKLEKDDSRAFKEGSEIYYSLRKQIESWMSFIVPHIQINVESYPKINSVRISLRNDSAKTDFLNPSNIGFGITYALPIIVSGLIAKKGSMLIVENPEAHLHPRSQSKIGQFLAIVASSGIQVVIETHSEHIINGARLAILKGIIDHSKLIVNFFSQKDESSTPAVNSITCNEMGDLSSWPHGFFDQEEQDLSEIFRSKKK